MSEGEPPEITLLSSTGGSLDTAWDPFIQHSGVVSIDPASIEHPDVLSATSAHFFGSEFSTEAIQSAFGLGSELPEVPSEKYVVLGLTNASALPIPMKDIIEKFEIDDALPKPLDSLFSVLKTEQVGVVLPEYQVDMSGKKNALWITADTDGTLEIVTSLSFNMVLATSLTFDANSEFSKTLQSFGLKVGDITFQTSAKPRFRCKHRVRIRKDGDEFASETAFEVIVDIPVGGFILSLRATIAGDLSVGIFDNAAVEESIFSKVADLLENSPRTEGELIPSEPGTFSGLSLWYITVDLTGEKRGAQIAFILSFKLLGQDVKLGLRFDTATKTFTGNLLFRDEFVGRITPDFDEFRDLPRGMELSSLPVGIDLKNGTGSPFQSVPNGIPTVITEGFFSYQKSGTPPSATYLISATIQDASVIEEDSVPAPFEWKSIALDFVKSNSGLSLSVFTSFQLNPRSPKFGVGYLSASMSYEAPSGSSSTWNLTGHAENIQLGAIAEFFEPGIQESIMDIIGRLSIQQLDVSYTYQGKVASSFLFSGIIKLGGLKLAFFYQYATKTAIDNKQTAANAQAQADSRVKPLSANSRTSTVNNVETAWRLDASLDTMAGVTTIGDVMDSFVEGSSDNLPEFVSTIEIKGSPTAKLVSLVVMSLPAPAAGQKSVLSVFQMAINAFELLFCQISTTTAGVGGARGTVVSKRILRFSANKIPLIENIPVVSQLPQPFDELQYLWVSAGGLTRTDVKSINDELAMGDKLLFKPAVRDATDPNGKTNPVVLVQGHHFIIVDGGEAVLDHVFGGNPTGGQPAGFKAPPAPPAPAQNEGGGGAPAANQPRRAADATVPATTPSKGAVSKTSAGLTISGLSLEFKEGMLWVFVDATLMLGPLSFSLVGFGIGLPISKVKLDDLKALADAAEFELRGMYVSFDKPPILIAGGFERETAVVNGEVQKSYRGGIGITIPPYSFVAVGEYAEITKPDQTTYKSVFIYAKLDGPLIDFGFAQLKGVRIGFGYNSFIRSPDVGELFQFPLISDAGLQGSGNNPMAIINALRKVPKPWITIKEDNYWFAFGLTASAFHIINATIVALVSIRTNGPVFTLLGNLTLSLPPKVDNDYLRLVYVEILASAELNFADDCFKLQGALSPASFVMNPFARLHGSMALWSFFGRSSYAGDYVFTLGGYHRKFQVPAHYPQPTTLERLGTTFDIGIIRISAGMYFAITPKAVMAGAAMHCELDIGPVFAYLDATFDAMVQFDPLHYWVSMRITVGVECDIPLLICTLHIKIDISALLEIEGPEFGGTAYVDFWFFSFSIPFGEMPEDPNPINLLSFYELCLKAGPPDVTNSRTDPVDDLMVQLKMNLEDGIFPMPADDTVKTGETAADKKPDSEGAGVKWYVKGGAFKFRVSSVFAFNKAWVETQDSAGDGTILLRNQEKSKLEQIPSVPTVGSIYSLPMAVSTPIESDLYIGITSDGGEEILVSTGWKKTIIPKPMPQVLWNSPTNPPNRLSADKGTVDLQMSVTFEAPPPYLSPSKIGEFNATDMAKSCAGKNKLPATEPTQTNFLAAELTKTPATWPLMQAAWESDAAAHKDLAKGMVDLCKTVLGWDKPAPDVVAKLDPDNLTPWVLKSGMPTRLVSGTGGKDDDVRDGLANFYLELPRVTPGLIA